MTDTITITVDAVEVIAHTPFHPDFPRRARSIGGDFQGGAWHFDPRDEARVRDLVRGFFGTDGSDNDLPTVTVRVPLNNRMEGYHDANNGIIRLAGREIIRRPTRDAAVRIGAGVIVVEGGFAASGGSVRWPQIGDVTGVVVEIRDLPAAVAEHVMSEVDGATVVGDPAARIADLQAERTRLIERLAEVDAALAAAGASA